MAKKKDEILDNKTKEKRNEIVIYSNNMQIEELNKMIEHFPDYLDERKTEFAKDLQQYIEINSQSGSFIPDDETKLPFYEIKKHIFKPIIRKAGVCPMYSADHMAVAFDYLVECTDKLNKYGAFVPKLSDFCRMLNISTRRFKEYKNTSNDENMREICQKIDDYCSGIVDDAALSDRIDSKYSIFYQKSVHDRRDNDPVNNNILIQRNNIMSDKEIDELMKKFIN